MAELTKSISHHFETMVETIVAWYLQGTVVQNEFRKHPQHPFWERNHQRLAWCDLGQEGKGSTHTKGCVKDLESRQSEGAKHCCEMGVFLFFGLFGLKWTGSTGLDWLYCIYQGAPSIFQKATYVAPMLVFVFALAHDTGERQVSHTYGWVVFLQESDPSKWHPFSLSLKQPERVFL